MYIQCLYPIYCRKSGCMCYTFCCPNCCNISVHIGIFKSWEKSKLVLFFPEKYIKIALAMLWQYTLAAVAFTSVYYLRVILTL